MSQTQQIKDLSLHQILGLYKNFVLILFLNIRSFKFDL